MSIGKNIKALRESKGISQLELGQIVGVSDKAVSTWENDLKVPRMGKIQQMADYFGVKKSDIIEDNQSPVMKLINTFDNISPIQKKKYPLLGSIACGQPIFADEDKETFISADIGVNADFCLRAKGDSMINARINDGDIVFIKEQSMVENGEIGAVIIEDEATLKRVYYYPEKSKLILSPENPAYEPLVYIGEELNEIRILGKAVFFMSLL